MDYPIGHIEWHGPWAVLLLVFALLTSLGVGIVLHRLNIRLRAEITRRTEQEKALADRERLLRNVLELSPELVMVLDRNGLCVEVFSHSCKTLNLSAEDIRGHSIYEVMGLEQPETMHDIINDVLVSKAERRIDFSLCLRAEQLFFQAQIRPFSLNATDAETVLWVAHNVTPYKLQERALADSKRNLELALEGVAAGIWVIDIPENLVFRGGKWGRHLGYDFDEIPADATLFIDFVHPEDYAHVEQTWRNHIEGKANTFQVEHRMLRADGSACWVLTWGKVVERDAQGTPLVAAGIHVDINERKRITEALEDSEMRYRLLIENIPHVTWLADFEGENYFISSNVSRVLGLSRERILEEGARLWEHRVHPEDTETFKTHLRLLFEKSLPYDITYRFLRADGVYIWIREQTRISEHTDGKKRVMGILLDITQSIRDAERLKAALREARRLNNSRSLFMASVSHELRNSLHAISGLVDLLMAERDTKKTPIHLAQLKYQTESLNFFTSDILEFSSLETGNFKPVYSSFNFLEMLDSLAELTRYKCAEKGLFFDYQLPQRFKKQYITTDRFRLRQSLFNLLHNAVKFTQSGTVRLAIAIETVNEAENDHKLVAAVSDTGAGIPKALQDIVFQPYFTNGTHDGAGLGLAIVQGMISALKGSITLKSLDGKGSTFTIELPIRFEDAVQVQSANSPYPRLPGATTSTQKTVHTAPRILVVDDEPVNRHLTVSWLEARNFECDFENDGEHALSRVLTKKYDAVLCDLHLPGMSGISLVKAIRSQLNHAERIPVFALSADTAQEIQQQAMDAGFDAVFAKPMPMAAVEALLSRLPSRPYIHNDPTAVQTHTSDITQSELAHLFMAELPDYHLRIKEFMAAENWHGALEQLHKIKGALTVMGYKTLKEHSENLEKILRESSFADELRTEACIEFLEKLNKHSARATLCD